MANDGKEQPNMHMPQTLAQIGPTVRAPIWPTIPRQSTNPESWSIVRFYSVTLAPADTDNVVNQPALRRLRFSLPTTLLAWNAGVNTSDGSGFPNGWDRLDTFEFKVETENGELITTNSTLGGSILGTGRRPGFTWGGGWPLGVGSTMLITLTPRLALVGGAALRINVTFPCLETRVGSSLQIAKPLLAGATVGQI